MGDKGWRFGTLERGIGRQSTSIWSGGEKGGYWGGEDTKGNIKLKKCDKHGMSKHNEGSAWWRRKKKVRCS